MQLVKQISKKYLFLIYSIIEFYLNDLIFLKIVFYYKVITLETNRFREDCLRSFLVENGLSDRVKILNKNFHELDFHDLSEVEVPALFN